MALSLLLMGCGGSGSVYDDYGRKALFEKVNTKYEAQDYSASRDAAESFIASFPQDEQIDVIRLKLLASYIHSSHYLMASAYADRLLQGSLLDEMYYEDVEYYKIVLKIEKSKHNYATILKMSNVFRNFTELESVIDEMDAFIAEYPNSAYLEELEKYRADVRYVLAEHQLKVALHYAKKGNFEGMNQRLALYYEHYGDVKTPLLDDVLEYQQ